MFFALRYTPSSKYTGRGQTDVALPPVIDRQYHIRTVGIRSACVTRTTNQTSMPRGSLRRKRKRFFQPPFSIRIDRGYTYVPAYRTTYNTTCLAGRLAELVLASECRAQWAGCIDGLGDTVLVRSPTRQTALPIAKPLPSVTRRSRTCWPIPSDSIYFILPTGYTA